MFNSKPVIRVNFSKLIFIHHMTAGQVSFPLMYGLLGSGNIWPIYNYLKILNLRVQKNLHIENITFKIVSIKFLAMHITNTIFSFDIFTVGNLLNIFMKHDLYLLFYFGINKKLIILTHTIYFCATYDWFCAPGSHLTIFL